MCNMINLGVNKAQKSSHLIRCLGALIIEFIFILLRHVLKTVNVKHATAA